MLKPTPSERMIKHMKKLNLLAVAAALASVVCTVPTQAKVNVIQSSSPVLARGATFAWAPVPAVGYGVADPDVANQITAERLRAATESTLAAKGYRQVANPAEADLLVAYTIVMLPEQDARLNSNGAGCPPACIAPSSYSLDTRLHTQGTLVLDLVERRTGRLVWRATSKKRVTGKDASEKKLASVLNAMTKALPVQ